MRSKKSADVGVKELHRFEKRSGGSFHWRVFERSWASMRATRRPDVMGLVPFATSVRRKWLERGSWCSVVLTQSSEQTQACRTTSHTHNIVDVGLPGGAGVRASE